LALLRAIQKDEFKAESGLWLNGENAPFAVIQKIDPTCAIAYNGRCELAPEGTGEHNAEKQSYTHISFRGEHRRNLSLGNRVQRITC
jgi:hypothetical protein